MILKVLGSGSSGNCYLLSHNNRTLILDVGIPYKEIIKGLNFDLTQIDGIIVTHTHKDHSLAIKDFTKAGYDVWKPYEEEKEIQTKQLGIYKVSCFPVPHDDTPCRGFLIQCDNEKLLYATDFEYISFTFKKHNINHLLIECNYIPEMVQEDAENRNHVIRGHASLNTTIDIIKDLKTDYLHNVILCHLSNDNSDIDKIINEVSKVVSRGIYVAQKGISISLDDCPF